MVEIKLLEMKTVFMSDILFKAYLTDAAATWINILQENLKKTYLFKQNQPIESLRGLKRAFTSVYCLSG